MTTTLRPLHSAQDVAVDPDAGAVRDEPWTAARAAAARDREAATRGTVPRMADQPFFVPLLLLSLAIVSWFAFQSYQLFRERSQLIAVYGAQQVQVDGAAKTRAAVDALAASTQRLANDGDVNARVVVDELRKRGVTINPNPVPTPAATPAAR